MNDVWTWPLFRDSLITDKTAPHRKDWLFNYTTLNGFDAGMMESSFFARYSNKTPIFEEIFYDATQSLPPVVITTTIPRDKNQLLYSLFDKLTRLTEYYSIILQDFTDNGLDFHDGNIDIVETMENIVSDASSSTGSSKSNAQPYTNQFSTGDYLTDFSDVESQSQLDRTQDNELKRSVKERKALLSQLRKDNINNFVDLYDYIAKQFEGYFVQVYEI